MNADLMSSEMQLAETIIQLVVSLLAGGFALSGVALNARLTDRRESRRRAEEADAQKRRELREAYASLLAGSSAFLGTATFLSAAIQRFDDLRRAHVGAVLVATEDERESEEAEKTFEHAAVQAEIGRLLDQFRIDEAEMVRRGYAAMFLENEISTQKQIEELINRPLGFAKGPAAVGAEIEERRSELRALTARFAQRFSLPPPATPPALAAGPSRPS